MAIQVSGKIQGGSKLEGLADAALIAAQIKLDEDGDAEGFVSVQDKLKQYDESLDVIAKALNALANN